MSDEIIAVQEGSSQLVERAVAEIRARKTPRKEKIGLGAHYNYHKHANQFNSRVCMYSLLACLFKKTFNRSFLLSHLALRTFINYLKPNLNNKQIVGFLENFGFASSRSQSLSTVGLVRADGWGEIYFLLDHKIGLLSHLCKCKRV